MAKKATKTKPKPSSTTTTSLKPTSSSSSSSSPQPPYTLPPPSLAPFLSTLDPARIYITHVDRHPASFKRRLFLVPLLLNLTLTAGLSYRIYTIAPYYYQMLLATWGHPSALFPAIDPASLPWPALLQLVLTRSLTPATDLLLFAFVSSWPRAFFFGADGNNPSAWRAAVGFRAEEIAVRRSRPGWDASLPKTWLDDQSGTDPAVADAYARRIVPAVDRAFVREKSAYLMLNESWDLDFAAMARATALVDDDHHANNSLALSDLEKQVLAHHPRFGWVVWAIWRLDEGGQEAEEAKKEAGRRKIVEFKERLTGMGKEGLFFRWVEIVQFHSEQEGGFTPERQARAMREAKTLFEEQGVDFDAFWEEVGGMEGLPGMEGKER